MTVDEVLERYDQVKTTRSAYENTLEELGKYVWPQMQDIVHEVKDDDGHVIRTVDIYDSTAIIASFRMAAGILGNLMPVGRKIFEFAAQDDHQSNNRDMKKMLAKATSAVHKVIWESNFIGQVFNMIRSLVVFTLGVISIEKSGSERIFKSYHIRDMFFERNNLGRVDVVFYRMHYTARQAKQAFGDNLGKSVENALKDTGKTTKDSFEFVHCVYPSDEYDQTKIGSKAYKYMIVNVKDKHPVDEGTYKDIKYRVVQYGENLDGAMGYSPSLEMLPEIKMLSAMKKTFIVSCEKQADPAMMVEDDGVIGQPSTSSGGLIVVRSGAQYPQPWKSEANNQLTDIFIEKQQQIVREAFLNDVFDALKYYRRETAAELKEMEIVQRIEEGFVVLAPVVAAIQRDLLNPMVMDIFRDLTPQERGDLPSDFDMKIVYLGRLAMAMNVFETTAIETVLAKWAPYDEAYYLFDNLDLDKAFVKSALDTGWPSDLVKDEDDIRSVRAQRQADKEIRQQIEMAQNAAKAYRDVESVSPQSAL